MKYIKTKDGIYEIRKECKLSIISDEMYYVTDQKNFYSYEALKQSDNMYELFDELICDERLIAKFCNVNETIKRLLSEGKTVYGAIWTEGDDEEPILKSVAKMNKEGEWRLI